MCGNFMDNIRYIGPELSILNTLMNIMNVVRARGEERRGESVGVESEVRECWLGGWEAPGSPD